MEYIISKVTLYDSDDQLWYTKIGENQRDMPLFCIVAGKTVKESRSKAEKLLNLLQTDPYLECQRTKTNAPKGS